ncbi:PP2C family protein-serine/threonine phosphatase, partial [Actinoallomurus acaciae]
MAVGDVVGHGLAAACVMGQLRSALSAGIQVVEEPAQALRALGRYARSIDGALAGTAVQAVIGKERQTITYSCAGHLPPVLLQPDGTAHFLDQATDPPLGVRLADAPRSQADLPYEPGATLVLYTGWSAAERTSTTVRAASPRAFAGAPRSTPSRRPRRPSPTSAWPAARRTTPPSSS